MRPILQRGKYFRCILLLAGSRPAECKEQAMIDQRDRSLGSRSGNALAILTVALVFAMASAILANPNNNTKTKPTDVPAKVIAHLPLASPAGNQMILQKLGDKRYLYIQEASKKGYVVVEVTKPEFPSFVKRQEASKDSTAGDLQLMDEKLGLSATPDNASKTAIRSVPTTTETVRILDLSDPANPTTLQTFKNVTSMLADGGRGIIYLTNDEGLWVLKHNRQRLAPETKKKPCDSYTAIQAMPPDCE
jgi:hypothetical protein